MELLDPKGDRLTLEAQKVQEYVGQCLQPPTPGAERSESAFGRIFFLHVRENYMYIYNVSLYGRKLMVRLYQEYSRLHVYYVFA